MLYKMRVLFQSKDKKAERCAQAIARHMTTTSDQIPPAYPSEGEKLLFICLNAGGAKAEKNVADFVANLNPARAKNIAIVNIGKGDAGEALATAAKANGVELAGSIYKLNLGMFGGPKQEQIDALIKWADEIAQSLVGK